MLDITAQITPTTKLLILGVPIIILLAVISVCYEAIHENKSLSHNDSDEKSENRLDASAASTHVSASPHSRARKRVSASKRCSYRGGPDVSRFRQRHHRKAVPVKCTS